MYRYLPAGPTPPVPQSNNGLVQPKGPGAGISSIAIRLSTPFGTSQEIPSTLPVAAWRALGLRLGENRAGPQPRSMPRIYGVICR
jgi:hypothetical protein